MCAPVWSQKKDLRFSSQKAVFEALESGKFQTIFQNEDFDGNFTGDNSMVLGYGYQGQGKPHAIFFFPTNFVVFCLSERGIENFQEGENFVIIGNLVLLEATVRSNVLKADATYRSTWQ